MDKYTGSRNGLGSSRYETPPGEPASQYIDTVVLPDQQVLFFGSGAEVMD